MSSEARNTKPQDPEDLTTPDVEGEGEEKKPDISARIFFIVIGVFVLIVIAAALVLFLNVFNNANGLSEMPVYEGSKAVTAPKNPFTSLETELKARKLKSDFLMAHTTDDLTKVQTFYNTQMKDKKYEQSAVSFPAAGQIFGQFKSFGTGTKVIVYKKKESEKEFYFLITNPITDRNLAQITSELKFSVPPKIGDTLILLARVA